MEMMVVGSEGVRKASMFTAGALSQLKFSRFHPEVAHLSSTIIASPLMVWL